MERIINNVLSGYFTLFIKDYTPDQFQLNFLKGTGSLHDLQLNEEIMQELLMLPTTLYCTKVTVENLYLAIPLYFRTQPIEITLENVVVHLEEPDTVPPFPCKLQQLWAEDAQEAVEYTPAQLKKAKERFDIVHNLTYIIKNLSLQLTIKSHRDSVVSLVIHNARMRSVTPDWKDAELAKTRRYNLENGTETLYKLMSIDQISIIISDKRKGVDVVIADKIPASYRMITTLRSLDGISIAGHHEFVFEEMHFSWDMLRYAVLMDFSTAISTALAREVPPNPEGEQAAYPVDFDASYKFIFENWSITLEDELEVPAEGEAAGGTAVAMPTVTPPDGTKPGVKLSGSDWLLVYIPKRKTEVTKEQADLSYHTTEMFEAVTELKLPSLECHDIVPAAKASRRFPKFLSQVRKTKWNRVSAKKILAQAGGKKSSPSMESIVSKSLDTERGDEPFFSFSYVTRWKPEDDGKYDIEYGIGDTEMRLGMNSMQIVLDRTVVTKVAKFMAGPPVDEEEARRDKLQKVFDKYDADNSGAIDLDEFQQLVSDLTGKKLSKLVAKQYIDQIDEDGNEQVEFEELYQWWLRTFHKAQADEDARDGDDSATASDSVGEEGGLLSSLGSAISWTYMTEEQAAGWADFCQKTWLVFRVNDTHFIIPDSPEATDHFANTSIDFAITKFHAFNAPKWHQVPNLPGGLDKLPNSKYLPVLHATTKATNRIKFQVELDGVYCNILSHPTKARAAPQVHRVIEPTRIVMYGRYVPGSEANNGDALEVMTSMNRLNVVVTNLHYDYFFYTYNVHMKWVATLSEVGGGSKDDAAGDKEVLDPEAAKAEAEAKKRAAEEEARVKALEEKRRKLREKKAAKRREKSGEKGPEGGSSDIKGGKDKASGGGSIGNKDGKEVGGTSRFARRNLRDSQAVRGQEEAAALALEGFKTIFFFRLDEGSLSVPLNWVETDLTMTAPSRIAFTALEVVVEMAPKMATYMASISNISAKGMDHPSLPVYISLLPRKTAVNDAAHTLKVLYATDSSLSEDNPISDISLSFRNTSLLFQGKQAGITDITMVANSLAEWGASLGEYFSTHNEEIKLQVTDDSSGAATVVTLNPRSSAESETQLTVPGSEAEGDAEGDADKKSDVQDVSYALDVGEIEVLLFDAPPGGVTDKFGLPPPTATPRSKFTLARVRRDIEGARIHELESMAVQAKLALVESETERERLVEEVAQLRRALETFQAADESTGSGKRGGSGVMLQEGVNSDGSFKSRLMRRVSARRVQSAPRKSPSQGSTVVYSPPVPVPFPGATIQGPPSMMSFGGPPPMGPPGGYMPPDQYHMWMMYMQQQQQQQHMSLSPGGMSPHMSPMAPGGFPSPGGSMYGGGMPGQQQHQQQHQQPLGVVPQSPQPGSVEASDGSSGAERAASAPRGVGASGHLSESDGLSPLRNKAERFKDRRRRASEGNLNRSARRKSLHELRMLQANMQLDELTEYLSTLPAEEADKVKDQLWKNTPRTGADKSGGSSASRSAGSRTASTSDLKRSKGSALATRSARADEVAKEEPKREPLTVDDLVTMIDAFKLREVQDYLASLPADQAKPLQRAMKAKLKERR